jgi:hypothetical protein
MQENPEIFHLKIASFNLSAIYKKAFITNLINNLGIVLNFNGTFNRKGGLPKPNKLFNKISKQELASEINFYLYPLFIACKL